MLIIVSAADQISLEYLNNLVQRFDLASHSADLDRVTEEASRLVGGRVQSLLRQRLKGFGLAPDEISTLSDRIVRETLEGTGRTRLRRKDIVPEDLVRQMRSTAVGGKLLGLLSHDLQHELGSATYIRADLAQKLTNEINSLLNRPDLGTQLGIGAKIAPESAIQRTRDNASMLASALPAISRVEDHPVHFWGFLRDFALPAAVRDITNERGRLSANDKRMWDIISPVVQNLETSLGHPPLPEEVHAELRRQSQTQYGPTIQWIEDRIKILQPNNAFKIKDAKALADAKRILIENGVPEGSLSPGGEHYVPKAAVKQPGLPTISRLMKLPGLMGPAHSTSTSTPLEQAPAPSSTQEPEAPSWALQMGQLGRGGELYRAMVEILFPATQSVERQVGEFLAINPSPTAEDVEAFLDELSQRDPNAAALARDSWQVIVRRVDRAVADGLGDERLMSLMSGQFGFSALAGIRFELRKSIFLRTNRLLRIAT